VIVRLAASAEVVIAGSNVDKSRVDRPWVQGHGNP
jgi:hypothetical protein